MFKKIYFGILIIFLLLSFSFSFLAFHINAQVPNPLVPCGGESSPEFHSLRPYQASPCGDSRKALYCGNDILIYEIAQHTLTSTNESICSIDEYEVNKLVDKTYEIAMKDMELPILGNTQDVKNSQNSEEGFDDATKLNEYVSWYLSGANVRAENGIPTDDQIVNFSGPIQKLFPSAIQDFERIKTIESVTKRVKYTNTEVSGDQKPEVVDEPENHNQTVACADGESAVECPSGEEVKLKDWDEKENLSGFNTFFNLLGASKWKERYPPLPWQFEKDIYYQKAYSEWRGKTCAIIPLINKLVCGDIPIVSPSQKWSNLFQYVPLANTSDKNANVWIPEGHAEINTITGTTISPERPNSEVLAEQGLFFPHTVESAQLSSLLTKSYIPQEGTSEDIDPLTTEPDKDERGKCRVINVRANEGDDLFPEADTEPYIVDVDPYTIETIPCNSSCTESIKKDTVTGNIVSTWSKKCEGGVTVEIKTQPKTPNAAEIYKNTVAGSSSILRKIFPKVEAGAPISCIANIPTVSNVNYEIIRGTDEISVTEPDGNKTDGTGSKLYLPYIGSVYEYFLKGIQTALRPQGFGESITQGEYCKVETPKDCEGAGKNFSVPAKFSGSFKSNFIDLADRWTATCPGADNNLAEECYDFVVDKATKEGVNPAFALTIWLNESGASNYCFGGATTQDMGINLPVLYQDIVGQADAFMKMANTKLCSGVSGFTEPMHGWLSRFQSSDGVCDPSDTVASDYYYAVKDETWSFLTSCAKDGKFGITWPTDTSCP